MQQSKQIGQILIELGYLTQEQLVRAVMEQKRTGERLGNILVRHDYVTPEQLAEALAVQAGVEYVRLTLADVRPEALTEISPAVARKIQVLPLWEKDGRLQVAPLDIHNVGSIQEAYRLIRKPISLVSANSVIVESALRFYYPLDTSEYDLCAFYPCVTEFLAELVREAREQGAKAIHIEPEGNLYYVVYYQVGQRVERARRASAAFARMVVHRLKRDVGINPAWDEPFLKGYLRIEGFSEDTLAEVSLLETPRGERVVIRRATEALSDPFATGETGEKPALMLEQVLSYRNGLLVVSSQDGAACHALLGALARRRLARGHLVFSLQNIPVPETPNYFYIPLCSSSPRLLNEHLHAVGMHAPDVLIAGYVDNGEALQAILSACAEETWGVLAVRAADPADAISWLQERGVSAAQLCTDLLGIVHVDTLPRLCDQCKRARSSTAQETALLDIEEALVYDPGGCEACRGTGYRGTVNVHEVLMLDNRLHEYLLRGATGAALRSVVNSYLEAPLRDTLRYRVLSGQISPFHAHILLEAYNPADAVPMLKAA